jgi:acyl-CoA thioester hydrolase
VEEVLPSALDVERLLAKAFGVERWTLSVCFAFPLNISPSQLTMHPTFELTVPILPSDIDGQDHVNNTVYLRWVQDVATAHWLAFVAQFVATHQSPVTNQVAALSCVVLRHEIDYRAPAMFGDEIVLRTWVGKASRLTFERFTEIRRKNDDQLLSQARTLWVPINMQTGRPTRVPAEVHAQFSHD